MAEIKEALAYARQASEFVNFCNEAKKDPDIVLSTFTEALLKKMIRILSPYFSALLVDEIEIKSAIYTGGPKRGRGSSLSEEFDIAISMKPVKPYVEAVAIINGVATSSVRLTFQLDSRADIEKMRLIHISSGTKKALEMPGWISRYHF